VGRDCKGLAFRCRSMAEAYLQCLDLAHGRNPLTPITVHAFQGLFGQLVFQASSEMDFRLNSACSLEGGAGLDSLQMSQSR